MSPSTSGREDVERLAAIGFQAGGLFHDLRGLVNAFSGYAELMALATDHDDRMKYLDHIWEHLEDLRAMCDEVLAFARGDTTLLVRRVYLNRFWDQMSHRVLDSVAGMGVDVTFDARYVGVAYFDEAKIVRVFNNIVRNAAEAMGGSGALRISTVRDGDSLLFEFSDTGPGIPSELQHTLFQPFATTKDSGTGLGLAICRSIVEEHRGEITCESALGRGSTFRVCLPVAPAGVSCENASA